MARGQPEDVSVSDRAGTTSVELRGVTVQAGQRILLENTSIRFDAGKVTLIVGRSGVGKTTLLKAIAGLIDEREEGLTSVGGDCFVRRARASSPGAAIDRRGVPGLCPV